MSKIYVTELCECDREPSLSVKRKRQDAATASRMKGGSLGWSVHVVFNPKLDDEPVEFEQNLYTGLQ